MSARTEIAAAASSRPGIKVFPFYQQTTKPGTGWVELRVVNYPNRFGGVATWRVYVVTPQDHARAEKWIEDNAAGLIGALKPCLAIDNLTPAEVQLPDGGSVNALYLEGHRESDY